MPTFEIGLTMAGAVSAGAYTAGVLDFLVEALDQWYDDHEGHPPHDIRIRVISGASAGAIAAAVFASGLRDHAFAPVREGEPRRNTGNRLYDTWVAGVDLMPLLAAHDLEDDNARLRSMLDSTALDGIAAKAMDAAWGGRQGLPPWLADPLELYLCVTNLRGVGYSMYFSGPAGDEYGMTRHADYMHFSLSPAGRPGLGGLALGREDGRTGPWAVLSDSALASGAFPVGLAARPLSRRADEYGQRRWPIPQCSAVPRTEPVAGLRCGCVQELPIHPAWPQGEHYYHFVCVDGGVINNEPFDLARKVLLGDDPCNPRSATEASRAVLMIDPFPEPKRDDPAKQRVLDQLPLTRVLPDLLGAMLAQLRFKTEDLVLARDRNVYSRFIIAPSRWVGGQRQRHAIASGGLGGFAGFLSRHFRHHDYQLGRLNCQNFLRKHFVLDERNPLFAEWPDALKHQRRLRPEGRDFDALPIIPLTRSAARPAVDVTTAEFAPLWPVGKAPDRDDLRTAMKDRVQVVMGCLAQELGGGLGTALRLASRFGKGQLTDRLLKIIEDDLHERGLLVQGTDWR